MSTQFHLLICYFVLTRSKNYCIVTVDKERSIILEIYERIKKLRKEVLKLSQTAFAERLGTNRDVINNIENNRLSKPEQKSSLYKLICREFNVSEAWLLDGKGDIYSDGENFDLGKFVETRGCSELEMEILKAYFELDPELRHKVLDHFKTKFSVISAERPHAEAPDSDEGFSEEAFPVPEAK